MQRSWQLGVIPQQTVHRFLNTCSKMDTGTFLVVEHVVSTAVEGAVLAGIGLAQLTQVPCAKSTPFIILLIYSCRGTSTYSCGR